MDLRTRYLGFELPHPFIPGASPLVDDLDTVRRLEDAGAAAIVMHSLFEEQIVGEELATVRALDEPAESFAEALSYLPEPDDFALGPHEYLEQLQRIKETVAVPVIASLNGTSRGGWLEYARLIRQAGADGLELNVYELVTDPMESSEDVEERTLEMVREVIQAVEGLPVAVKLSPFYTAPLHFAQLLDRAGAAGLVLFNRFYQADLDIEELEVERTLHLSERSELLLRLRWLAILEGKVGASLAVTGGVHEAEDAVKAILCGANAVQVVSTLLRRGPERLATLRDDLARWLMDHEYDSLEQMRGTMSLARCPDPHAFERANYLHLLQSWRREGW
ncbi:MAG: dihydroorotate dehydrogenase-like protein [Acidobacteria bacterium]|nr:dihydroorotate dehydrogenase-like protein [Acidobacteriota bacterium]